MTANQPSKTLPLILRIGDWRMAPKLLVAFLVLSMVPLATTSISAIRTSSNALLNQGAVSLVSSSQATSATLDQYMTGKREDIVAISKLPDLIDYAANPSDVVATANAFQALRAIANKTDYESVAIATPDGKIIASSLDSDIGTDIGFRPYFIEALKGNSYISDPSVSVVTNRPAIFFSAPIRDAVGKTYGIVRSRLSLDGIWGLVEKDKDMAGAGTYGILLDENGIRLANSLSLGNRETLVSTLLYTSVMPVPPDVEKTIVAEKRFGNATTSSVRVFPLPEVGAAMTTPGIKTFETTADNSSARHYAAISAMSTKPWRYVLMTPLSTFTSASDNLGLVFALQALITTLVVLLATFFISRAFTRPIIQLTKVADNISLGELDAKIDITREDEIGELAEAISRMQASLQAAIERLRARRASS